MRNIQRILISVYYIINPFCFAKSSEFEQIPYSLALIYDGDRPICQGIILQSTVISAAHCVARQVDLRVWYLSHGRPRLVRPLNLQFDQGRGKAQSPMDLVAIRLPVPMEADSDGKISLNATSINAVSASDFQFTIENKPVPDDISREDVETNTNIMQLKYEKTLLEFIQFHQADVAAIAKFTQTNKRVGAFSLSMSKPMSLKHNDLICQGQSGSPVFGIHDGVKLLIGIAVKGRRGEYLDDRWCSSTLFALRMDAAGIASIIHHVQ